MSEALAGLSRFALRGVFNNAEIIALFQHRETLEYLRSAMTERFEIDVYSISEDLRRSEQFFVPQYVMKINTPRYHENVNCEQFPPTLKTSRPRPKSRHWAMSGSKHFKYFANRSGLDIEAARSMCFGSTLEHSSAFPLTLGRYPMQPKRDQSPYPL